MAMLGIVIPIPRHSALHPRLIQRGRIKPPDLRLIEDNQPSGQVVRYTG